MQQFVIDWLLRKNLFVVEEMHFLPIGQCDLRMFPQEIMKRSRSRLLRTRHNEIEPLNLSPLGPKHSRTLQLVTANWRGRQSAAKRYAAQPGGRTAEREIGGTYRIRVGPSGRTIVSMLISIDAVSMTHLPARL